MAFLKADMPMAPYVDIFTGDLERLGAGERYDTNRLWAEPGGGIRGGARELYRRWSGCWLL